MREDVGHELDRRRRATALVRLATWASVALGLLLTTIFTIAAAGSTHSRRAVGHVVRARRRVVVKPVVAPAPPLVSVASPSPRQQAPPPSPAPTPAPAAAAPVVVSGGS